jgi:GSCFA family
MPTTGQASLRRSRVVFVTLGTAWVYELAALSTAVDAASGDVDGAASSGGDSGRRVVGNCHKLPQSQFTRRLQGAEEVASELRALVAALQSTGVEQVITTSVLLAHHLISAREYLEHVSLI